MDDFDKSIAEAKKANPKELAYIQKVVNAIRATGDTTSEKPPAFADMMDVK